MFVGGFQVGMETRNPWWPQSRFPPDCLGSFKSGAETVDRGMFRSWSFVRKEGGCEAGR